MEMPNSVDSPYANKGDTYAANPASPLGSPLGTSDNPPVEHTMEKLVVFSDYANIAAGYENQGVTPDHRDLLAYLSRVGHASRTKDSAAMLTLATLPCRQTVHDAYPTGLRGSLGWNKSSCSGSLTGVWTVWRTNTKRRAWVQHLGVHWASNPAWVRSR